MRRNHIRFRWLSIAVVVSTMFCVPHVAAKEALFGAYVDLFAGFGVPANSDISLENNLSILARAASFQTSRDVGFFGGLAIGTEIFDNLRGEIELSHQRNELGDFSTTGSISGQPIEGDTTFQTTTIYGNLWYDFLSDAKISPYVGGGVGLGIINAEVFERFDFGSAIDAEATGAVFAFQLGTGININLTERVGLGLGYRFRGFAGTDNRLFSSPTGTSINGVSPTSHNVIGSFRFRF